MCGGQKGPGSLAVLEEEEEEDPEGSHDVPVPDGGVDEDLAGGERARELEGRQCGDEAADAEEQMHGVGDGDEVEEVAARVGAKEDVLRGELIPGDPLTGEEEGTEEQSEREPDGGSAGDGAADAEPLVHGILFAEHGLAGNLGGGRAEDESGGVDPENGGDGGGEPLVDEVVVGVEVATGLGDEEDADQRNEEYEIPAEGEEEADASLGEAFARAAVAPGLIIPVVAITVAVATGTLVIRRPLAVVAITDVTMAVDLRRCECGRHSAR